MHGFMIVGTDTGVGKTRIACAILAGLVADGIRVAACKPFESGEAADSPFRDTALLWKAVSPDKADIPSEACTYRFDAPLAPCDAARLEGRNISLSYVRACAERLAQTCDLLLVEGAGGLLTPLLPEDPRVSFEDLALWLRLPVLVVARAGLGTLNHSRLTVERLYQKGLSVLGVVLNQAVPAANDLSTGRNADLLAELLPCPVWGPLPYRPSPDSEAKTIREAVDLAADWQAFAPQLAPLLQELRHLARTR